MDALEHNEDAASSWSSDYSSEDEHSYPMMHELVWLLAFDSNEWRPPCPPERLWYRVSWRVRVYQGKRGPGVHLGMDLAGKVRLN